MKNKLTLLFLLIFTFGTAQSQTIEQLYKDRDFEALVKYANKTDKLSPEELYYIGYAFFQLENDKKAIEMYDKAIAKGLDDDRIYLYKGLSLRYDKQYDKALENFKLAVNRNPKGQKNFTELANTFYYQKQYDSALVYFYEARALDFELGDPYFKIPNIYHIQNNFKKAMEEYHISATLIDKKDPDYLEILKSIGQLEYTVFKNYDKAIEAYKKMVLLDSKNFDLYPKLIKAYYANENYAQGDSLFFLMKGVYDNGGLSEEYRKFGSVAIDEFEWKGQKLATYRYFKEPEELLDIKYKIYLLSEDGSLVERTFMTEKTIQFDENGAKHLLCEQEKSGIHYTYPFGWTSDDIEYSSLKNAVILILDGGLTPSASSSVGVAKPQKKEK